MGIDKFYQYNTTKSICINSIETNNIDINYPYNQTSLADKCSISKSILVSGLTQNDTVEDTNPYSWQGVTCNAKIVSNTVNNKVTNTVEVKLTNNSGNTIDLTRGDWKIEVKKDGRINNY